jgi:indole-3-glycerol phosphate synthase
MNILDKIIAQKKIEVEAAKAKTSIKILEQSKHFNQPPFSFKQYLNDASKVGIIAEFKRKSPSKGIINATADVQKTTSGYVNAGASALSILTDFEFFGGTCDDVIAARKVVNAPILRKEFIIDEYQIIEAKSIGADVILLLANVLTANQIKQYAKFAKSLGLESLLEIRDKDELHAINQYVDAVGINNRNLKDFNVNLTQSFDLVDLIPNEFIKISESGIGSAKTIHELKAVGFKGFLMGETFMKQEIPELACAEFIKEVNVYKKS